MRKHHEEIGMFIVIAGFVVSITLGLTAHQGGWFRQYFLGYYLLGLVMMVLFTVFMWRWHRQSSKELAQHLLFSFFAAFFWWGFWAVGVSELIRGKRRRRRY